MTISGGDGWNAGVTYEDFMGRWSRPLAEEFVKWAEPQLGGHWLDVGTGTGALAAAICTLARPASVVGCDPSALFIESARRALDDSRVTFEVAGTGPAPNFVSGLPEERRVALSAELKSRLPTQPGGRIALTARAWAVIGHRV